jgi:hypothetical protein
MGHSEMLLAVAGLNDHEIKDRTKKLAAGDWSMFSAAEQTAFRFAYQFSKEPADVARKGVEELTKAYGRSRALDLIWYGSWCNYMTRVADAFQLPLETENVFVRPGKKAKQDEKKSKEPEKKAN